MSWGPGVQGPGVLEQKPGVEFAQPDGCGASIARAAPRRRMSASATCPRRGRPRAGDVPSACALLGDARRRVVADVRGERRHEHQRAREMLWLRAARGSARVRAGNVGRSSRPRPPAARSTRAGRQAITGLQTLSSKLPWLAARPTVVWLPIDRSHDHHQRLRLGRVDLARHDRGAGLVLGDAQLAEPGSADPRPASARRSRSSSGRPPACRARPKLAASASWPASAANLSGALTKATRSCAPGAAATRRRSAGGR